MKQNKAGMSAILIVYGFLATPALHAKDESQQKIDHSYRDVYERTLSTEEGEYRVQFISEVRYEGFSHTTKKGCIMRAGTTVCFDASGRKVSQTRADGSSTTYTYAKPRAVVGTTRPNVRTRVVAAARPHRTYSSRRFVVFLPNGRSLEATETQLFGPRYYYPSLSWDVKSIVLDVAAANTPHNVTMDEYAHIMKVLDKAAEKEQREKSERDQACAKKSMNTASETAEGLQK